MAYKRQFAKYDSEQHGNIDVQLEVPEEITAKLRDYGWRKLKNATRAALGQAATKIKRAAAGMTPVYSGILKQSLTKKDSKHTSKSIYSLVGARRRMSGPKIPYEKKKKIKTAARAAGKQADFGKAQISRPVRYLHLVEKGFQPKSGPRVPGKWMLKKGAESVRSEVTAKIREVLTQRLFQAKSSQEIPTT